MLPVRATFDEVYQAFRWPAHQRYNLAHDVVDKHALARPEAPALIFEAEDGSVTNYSFRQVERHCNKFANVLRAHGVGRGDRFAIQLSQCPEMAFAFVAAWKLGAVFIPISVLFGADALEYRLDHGDAVALVTDQLGMAKFQTIADRLPGLKKVFLIDGAAPGALDFWAEMEKASDQFQNADTGYNDPAYMSYTSGTTGQPKGALHAHRNLIGHLPCHDIAHEFYGQPGDLSWSPADWAWLAGLMDVLMPAWYHGKPVLAYRGKGPFDAEQALDMIARHRVRNCLFVPTMLKLMRQLPKPKKVNLRSIISGGETVGPELIEWGRRTFEVDINEIYGQTECNFVLAHVQKMMPPKIGSMGKSVPGHRVAIIDEDGKELGPGEEGHIAVRRPDPVMLLEYWKDPLATAEKYIGDWLITGDLGRTDGDGYFWFVGRADDVITTSGYRVGPGEIEDCLLQHPAVALAAAVGIPDKVRTEIIKVFIVPAAGVVPTPQIEDDIRAFVRGRLAKHETPREIEFIKEMPTTTTGKVMRRVLKQRDMEAKGLI